MWLWYKNWRSKLGGEIDLVVFKESTVTLIEVKTRRIDLETSFSAIEAVDQNKKMQLEKLLHQFKRAHRKTLKRIGAKKVHLASIAVYYSPSLLGPKMEAIELIAL